MSIEGKPLRILLADDHPIVVRGLKALIEQEPDMSVVAMAQNGREAVRLYVEHRPDVAILDLRMPEMDGIAATADIRKFNPRAKIIIVTTFDGEDDIYNALRAGASGYLLKDARREEIIEAIRHVHAGQKRVSPRAAEALADRTYHDPLTPREIQVLRLLAAGRSNQEIGRELGIVEGTVKVHVTNILLKLNVDDRTQAALSAIRRGLIHLD